MEGMSGSLHMIKLVVGCDTIDDLLQWRVGQEGPWILRTRQTPKRAAELLAGGSIYRVFKGSILCRQSILDVQTVGEGQESRCEITLDATIHRTAPTPRRAFQGWRYLTAADAPPDLVEGESGDLPTELALKLRELGAW
jgi:hypothetical protein